MNIRKEYPKVCLFLWILGMCFHAHPILAQSFIPVPLKMEQGTGSFLLSEKTKLYTNLQGGEAELWENYLKALPVQLKEARMKDRKQMLFLLITPKTPQLPSPESYTLSVTSQRIEIRATSGAGLFYGMQTLLQLMQPASTGSYSVPSVEIEDTPRFAYRGLMLDVSRHFSTKEFIKKQIDALAYYKINRLHLHLTDAAGWRLEIKKYPLLTDFAAWRTDPTWKKWWNGGRKYLRYDEPGASGGYYTQDDIREILEYARQHYITVIPEIEMPSHSEEVLAAYPQLSCSGEPYKNSDFCVGNEETFTFLENVLTEVMELFPSEYIHVGGDEYRQIGLEDLSEMSEENERRASYQCRRAAKLSDTPYRKVPQQSRTPSLGMGRDSARRYRAQCNRYVVAWRRGWYCCRHLLPSCHHDTGCILLSGQLSGRPVLPAGSYRWLPAIEESICLRSCPRFLNCGAGKVSLWCAG